MRLVVATNWDDALLRGMEGLPVHVVFGKLRQDLVGGGRPSSILPSVTWEDMARHISLAHALGFRFTYLWNATTLADAEFAPEFVSRMEDQLRRLVDVGVDGLVVGVPWMIALAKDVAPNLEVTASSLMDVVTPREARQFEAMGADTIVLHHAANRDFPVLDEIRASVRCDLELIVNNSCVFQCPYNNCHHVSPSFHSREGSRPLLEYELFWCAGRHAQDGAEIIRSRWIRPEDLHVYEARGYDRFKIAGRGRSTEWLLRSARAYAERSYRGDLTDIISMSQHAPLALAQRRAAEPGGAHGERWQEIALALTPLRDLRVEGAAIPRDFLEFFETHDCDTLSCRRCGYCALVARRAVRGVAGRQTDGCAPMPSARMFGDLILDRPAPHGDTPDGGR
jgi:collagenase-like PrtC family protease